MWRAAYFQDESLLPQRKTLLKLETAWLPASWLPAHHPVASQARPLWSLILAHIKLMARPSLGESPVRKLTYTVAKETYAGYRYFNRLVVNVTDQPANTKCWRKTSSMGKKKHQLTILRTDIFSNFHISRNVKLCRDFKKLNIKLSCC